MKSKYIYMDVEMKEKRKETTQPKIRMSLTSIIVVAFFTFTAFLFCPKTFSSPSGKRVNLSDPLGAALSGVARGLNNTQLAGKVYYEQYCMVCHGEEGKGDGFNAFNLDPRPKDLTSVTKFVSNESFCKAVANGARNQDGKILCPPWGRTLDKDKIVAIVDYIRTLGKSQ
ncbi:MAG: cytochrome c [Planctomycetes bacterium]|nr:cytochrome c [Planctomycetota bacterium]